MIEINKEYKTICNFSKRPNQISISGIVIHYTGGSSAINTLKWFSNPLSKVSAHYVISRTGIVYQCVELENAAWHAGLSKMKHYHRERYDVNNFTIGIELANRGYFLKDSSGDLFYESGRNLKSYTGDSKICSDNIHWEPYTYKQINALLNLFEYLYNVEKIDIKAIKNCVGHNEICTPAGRKIDPGPLFPWDKIKNWNPSK